ncbi:MAG: hypothetical protein QOJ12_1503 [Thermoleophilales bacterium]|nr:hypothetical protein [Thermoleophilales bacterium]
MRSWGAERLAAYSGVAFVVCYLLGFFVAGNPPDLNASAERWTLFFAGHHRRELAGAILVGVAFVAFLWFLGSLAAALRRGGETRLGDVALGCGLVAAAAAYVYVGLDAAAYRVGIDQPAMLKGVIDIAYVAATVASFPLAGLAGAVALASWRSGILPSWYAASGGLAAVVLLSSGGALAQNGFYRPDGPYAFAALVVFLLWTVVTSVLVASRAPTPGLDSKHP